MVVTLVRSQRRLLSFLSILQYFPQASALQPQPNKRRSHNLACPERTDTFMGQANKRMRKEGAVMQQSSLYSSSTADNASLRATFEVRRRIRYVSETRASDFVFRLVCYNLLAQHQIWKNSYLYGHCTEEVLEWERRKKTLCDEIQSFACDIMCLQEVQSDHYEEILQPFFESLGFESYFKSKTRKGNDGVAIVYRCSKFKLLAVDLVEFYRSTHSVLRADNVGLVMLLQPLSDPANPQPVNTLPPICVATTHLYFNANRGDVKLAQLSLLLASIERMARREGSDMEYYPVVFCGDLNSEPTSPLFRFLATGKLPDILSLKRSAISDQNLSAFWGPPTEKCLSRTDLPPPGVGLDCRYQDAGNDESVEPRGEEVDELEEGEIKEETIDLSHPFDFASVFPVPEETNRADRRVTSFTAHDVCCVDHIFYTPVGLRLVMFCDTVTMAEFTRVAGIPNLVHASDHIPLLVDFAVRSEEENKEEMESVRNKQSHRL